MRNIFKLHLFTMSQKEILKNCYSVLSFQPWCSNERSATFYSLQRDHVSEHLVVKVESRVLANILICKFKLSIFHSLLFKFNYMQFKNIKHLKIAICNLAGSRHIHSTLKAGVYITHRQYFIVRCRGCRRVYESQQIMALSDIIVMTIAMQWLE